MEFREQPGAISFEEAERRHAELKRRYDAGLISDEQFDAERQGLVVVDDQGRSWAMSRESGRWLYHDDGSGAWIEGIPPGFHQRAGSAVYSPEQLGPLGPVGHEAKERYCTNCGARMGSKATFCASCGEYQITDAGASLASRIASAQPGHGPADQRTGGGRTSGILIGLGVLGAVLVLGLVAVIAYPLVAGEEPAAVTPSNSSSETPSQPAQPQPAPPPLGANPAAEDSENTPVSQPAPPPPDEEVISETLSYEEELRSFAEDYYDAVALEDWEYLYALQDSLTMQKYTEDEYVQRNQYFAELDSLIETSTTISSEVSTSSPVEVTLTQTFESGATSSRITYFVWEDGSWKHRFSEEDDAIFLPDASYEEFVAANGGGGSSEVPPEEVLAVEDAVSEHYEAIGDGEFEEAYSYFGPNMQEQVGEEQYWVEGEEENEITGSTINYVEVEDVSGDQATATVDVSVEDKTGTTRFVITWSLINEAGGWMLESQLSAERLD